MFTDGAQERGLSEIETVADRYYENVHDRIRDAIPGKEPLGRKKSRKGKPVEDETGTGQPHVKWTSDRSSNRSPEPSDDEGSADDRRTTAKSMRSSRARSFDEPGPRRERVRDWDADSPSPTRARTWGQRPPNGDPYSRGPYRNSYQPVPYAAASATNLPYGRPPPPPYQPAYAVPHAPPRDPPRYRSRSISPFGRRRSRSSDPEGKGKKEKIKETIKPLAAGGAGMIAGAFIGHAAGRGDWAATIAGAVIGAIGGNEAEEYWEKRQGKKEKRKEKY